MENNETQTKNSSTIEAPLEVSEAVEQKTFIERANSLLESIGIDSREARGALLIVLVVVFFAVVGSLLLMPPSDFPENKIITVKNGASLGQVSLLLKEEHFIRSRTLFEFCVITAGGDKKVHAGQYMFKTPIGACALAVRITGGVSGIPAVRATFPEGLSNKEIAVILSTKFTKFDTAQFVEHTRPLEGYLFPDTYFFSDGSSTEEVETMMSKNFYKKIEHLMPLVEKSGHSLNEIIIMASILEKEATTNVDRELVSGILWKRIKNGMPLQVDAPFLYLLGKKSSEITQADLQIKSAYNTYRNKGLPGGPIGNPGIATISAAIAPNESPYLYYLSDNDGIMHYAKSFNEHIANKNRYLR